MYIRNKICSFCIADQIANVVESYKRKDHLFVETHAFREVEDIINDGHWALLTGKPGDGKSYMAAHLLLKYHKKGFEPIIVTSAQDWKTMVKGKGDESNPDKNKLEKQFVIIDDIFGSMCVDERKVNEWVSILEIMQSVVRERKGNLVVICTSRAHVFNDVKSKLKKFSCFQSKSSVNLTVKRYHLSTEEKEEIWTKYANEYNVTSEPPLCVYDDVISPHGFPHCVELFCSNHFLREQGVDFFENPMEYVCREILNFKENDKIKYCLLLLVLFNSKLTESQLQQICMSDPSKEVSMIFKAAGLSSDYAQSELKKALNSLKNTYISEDLDDTYHFSHESIRENVALIFIKDNPLHAIEEIELKFLVEHTRFHGYTLDGSFIESSLFVLPNFCSSALVERITREILNGNTWLACQHQAWDDDIFLNKWFLYILGLPDHMTRDFFTARNVSYTMGDNLLFEEKEFGLNFLETLMLLQKENTLLKILSHPDISGQLNDNMLKEILSQALICACFFLPSETWILRLIETGADVNFVIPCGQAMHYADCILDYVTREGIQDHFDAYSPLLCAVETRDVLISKLLLRNGANIFVNDIPAVLIAAVELNFSEILPELLQANAEPISDGNDKTRQAHLTPCCYEKYRDSISLANYNFTQFVPLLGDHCRLSLIHIASGVECLKVLLENGAEINKSVWINGKRMPHIVFRMLSTQQFAYKVLQFLLEAGLDLRGIWNGKTCIDTFLYTIYNTERNAGLEFSIESIWFPYLLLDGTEMQEYCSLCNVFLTKVSEIQSLNALDENGQTFLYRVMKIQFNRHIDILLIQRQLIVLETTISLGGDINVQDNEGISPAMLALCSMTILSLRTGLFQQFVEFCIKNRKPRLVDNTGRGYFHYLAHSGTKSESVLRFIQILKESGEDINIADHSGNVPLSECRSDFTFKCFIDAGANPDRKNDIGQNVLFRLLMADSLTTTLYVIQAVRAQTECSGVLKDTIDLNAKDNSGWTLMHCLMMCQATNLDVFKDVLDALLCAGCSLVYPDNNGVTPLMIAAANESIVADIFEYCLKQESDIFNTDVQNMSVLHHCVGSQRKTQTKLIIVQMLWSRSKDLFLKGSDIISYAVNETNSDNVIIVELVKYRNELQSVKQELVTELIRSGRPPCEIAKSVMSLEQEGLVKVNCKDVLFNSKISTQIKMEIASRLLENDMRKAHEIVLRKSDILQVLNWLNDDILIVLLQQISRQPFFKTLISDMQIFKLLCKQSKIKSIDYLIQHGILIGHQDGEGNTLLHLAADYISNDTDLLEIITSLLAKNTDVLQLNRHGKTALHVACRQRRLKPQSVYLLADNMSSVDQLDNTGMTALHYLCSGKQNLDQTNGFHVCLYLSFCLLSKDAGVDHVNLNGETVVMTAIRNRAWDDALIELLIQSSKSVNTQDANGNTALHKLARATMSDERKAYLFKLILQRGGNVNIKNKDNRTSINVIESQIRHKQVGFHLLGEIVLLGDIGSDTDAAHILFTHIATVDDETQNAISKIKDIIMKKSMDVNMLYKGCTGTLLEVACTSLMPNTAQVLLSFTADANVRNMVGCTCLTWILSSDKLHRLSLVYVIYTGNDVSKVITLQRHGYFWNNRLTATYRGFVDEMERTIGVGSRECFLTIEQLNSRAQHVLYTLLSNGADPNTPDIAGKSPLHHYVQSPLADIFICPAIKMLIDFGANVNSKDKEGMTPLMACLLFTGRKSRRLNILIAAGANIREVDNFGCDVVEYGKMAFGNMRKIHALRHIAKRKGLLSDVWQ